MPKLFKLLVKDLLALICFHKWLEKSDIRVTIGRGTLANRARKVLICEKCGKTKITL